jgi:hypothetical protein
MAIALLVIWFSFLCGGAAACIGATKGENWPAFFAGALLGPMGIILAYVSRGEDVEVNEAATPIPLKP